MYAIQNETIVKVDCKNLIKLGAIIDNRVDRLEAIVAKHFCMSVYDLDTFYKDSEGKLMVCFLLHEWLNYSVESIAVKYKIYPNFLQKNIIEYYHKYLINDAFCKTVNQLKDAFFDKVKTSQPILT